MLKLTYLISLISCLFVSNICKAQDSSHIQISLLTCTPGEELYSTFGHSAIRIIDSSSTNDIVFNFGTFNFDDEGFYLKFVQGKLLYFLSAERFQDFSYMYQSTGRGITEQILNFSPAEKINIQHELFENLKEENKYYLYDFFFDNCTTRLRDIIQKNASENEVKSSKQLLPYTFRNAIHSYLDRNDKAWSKLGIDLLLGTSTDRKMTEQDAQFLPDNLMNAIDKKNHQRKLVIAKEDVFPFKPIKIESKLFTPLLAFSMLLLLYVLASSFKNSINPLILSGMDGFIFFITGSIGILLIIMWTATNHAMCKYNFNLLWAIPFNTIMAFFVRPSKKWMRNYFVFQAAFLTITMIAWALLPQKMNIGFLPIALLLLYRSAEIYFQFNPANSDGKKAPRI